MPDLLYSLITHQLCPRYTTTRHATILCLSLCCLSLSIYTDVKVLPHCGRGLAVYSWSEAWPLQLKTSSANSPPGPSTWWGNLSCQWTGCLFCSFIWLVKCWHSACSSLHCAWYSIETNVLVLNSLCCWTGLLHKTGKVWCVSEHALVLCRGTWKVSMQKMSSKNLSDEQKLRSGDF